MQNFLGKVAVKILLEDGIGQVLVVRQHDKEDFELVGGRVDVEESIERTIRREVSEELQVDLESKDFKIIHSFQAVSPHENTNHLYLIVVVKIREDEKSQIQFSNEVQELIWINKTNYKEYKYKSFLKESIENYINK